MMKICQVRNKKNREVRKIQIQIQGPSIDAQLKHQCTGDNRL